MKGSSSLAISGPTALPQFHAYLFFGSQTYPASDCPSLPFLDKKGSVFLTLLRSLLNLQTENSLKIHYLRWLPFSRSCQHSSSSSPSFRFHASPHYQQVYKYQSDALIAYELHVVYGNKIESRFRYPNEERARLLLVRTALCTHYKL